MSKNNGLPTQKRIAFTGVIVALIMVAQLAYYESQNEFTWFRAGLFGFLWLSTMIFLIMRTRNMSKSNQSIQQPENTLESISYSLKFMGGFKGILKWSLITTVITLIAIISKVLIERQI